MTTVTDETDTNLTVRDNVIEGALAMLGSLAAEGRDAVFFFCKQGLWMSVDIHTSADIFALQEELADFEPNKNAGELPPEISGSSKTPVCFTAAVSENFASAEYIAARCPDAVLISSYAASLPVISANQWVLTDGFELNRV